MNRLSFYIFSVVLIVFGHFDIAEGQSYSNNSKEDNREQMKTQFEQFRQTARTDPKKALSACIDSSFSGPDLWYMVLPDNMDVPEKPFTHVEAVKYADKILEPDFIKALMDIDTHILFTAGNYETKPRLIEIDGEKSTQNISAEYKNRELILAYQVNVFLDTEDESEVDESQSVYTFVFKGNRLILASIVLAD
ncbi:hypothetical protein [Porphyromonas macacae]|uniref:Uncharacterized protein n=1 Tax=Porphyromonas macacae TaxID=28115 RepID=A0A379DHC0_9PORP|nr:hypothetical protein [Porphyromonas macacae]SUB77542.1 Uncharacterised protein [Porphyromonas macacae]